MLSVIPTTLLLLPHFLKGEKTGAPRNKDPFLILVKVFNFLKIVFKLKKKFIWLCHVLDCHCSTQDLVGAACGIFVVGASKLLAVSCGI